MFWTHTFDSPDSLDACTNKNVRVLYDREIRDGVIMSGAFCRSRPFEPGEFICAWNGVQVEDDIVEIGRLTNLYDLTKYALSYPSGRKNITLFSCVRLDKHGKPARLPQGDDAAIDSRDVSLAVFLNEPSPDAAAFYDDGTDTIDIRKSPRNAANVCLRTEKQRNGVVCPLMFASRRIQPGEELTWDYGQTDTVGYDRHLYTIDEERGIFVKEAEKYSATEVADNSCRVTCDTVRFRRGLPVSQLTCDVFLLGSETLTEGERSKILFRSDMYYPDRFNDDSDETASGNAQPARKKMKPRRRSFAQRVISLEDMQRSEMESFKRGYREVDQKAQSVLTNLQNRQLGGRSKNPDKIRLTLMLKTVILNALFMRFDYLTGRVPIYFTRTDFILPNSQATQFIYEENDVMWRDLLKMQRQVFLNVDWLIDRVTKPPMPTQESIQGMFDPNRFTAMYTRADSTPESVEDWKTPQFQLEHPTAHRVALKFFDRLDHLQRIIKYFGSWYTMHQELKRRQQQSQVSAPFDHEIRLLFEKADAFCKRSLLLLYDNADVYVKKDFLWTIVQSIMESLLISTAIHPIDPARCAERLAPLESNLRQYSVDPETLITHREVASELLDIMNTPTRWRCERMLLDYAQASKRSI